MQEREGGGEGGSRQRTGSGDGAENKCEEENGCNDDERSDETEKEKQETETGSGNGLRFVKLEIKLRLVSGEPCRWMGGGVWGWKWGGDCRASANDTVNLRPADCLSGDFCR